MDKLTSMRVFVKVVETGAFSTTATALDMSPQMVAKHITFLETELGTILLHRTTRRQNLSDIGRVYYEKCQMILADVEAADALAFELHTEPKGILKVSAPITFGAFSLPALITKFLQTYPEMRIDLSLTDRFVDPIEEGIEVMIRIGELKDSSMIARQLAPFRLIACASPDYLAQHGTPNTPQELLQHECLIYSNNKAAIGQGYWHFLKNGKKEQVLVDGRYHSNDWKTLLYSATAGMGITLGPESVLADEVKAGRLVPVLTHYDIPARPMHVVYPASRKPTAKLRSFVDALIAEFGES